MMHGESGWLASLLGAAVLIAGGFALGLVAGVVSEEPELVVGHLVGRSDEVAWEPERDPQFTDSAADPMQLAAIDSETAGSREEVELGSDPALRYGVGADLVEEAAEEEEAWPRGEVPAVEEPPAEVAPPTLPAVAAPPPPREVSSLPEAGEPAAPAARAPARSGFAVQVGAFSNAAAADEVRGKLERKGFESYVVSARESGDGKWRVRVGPVASRSSADALAGRLKSEERLPTWVLSEGGR